MKIPVSLNPIGAIVASGLLCAATVNAQTIYDITAGLPVDGSITLLSGISGPIIGSDVLSFDFTAFPGLAINGSVLGTSAGCGAEFAAGCGLTVSGDNLLWTGTITGSDEPPWYGIVFQNADQNAQNPAPNFTVTTAPLQGGPATYEIGTQFLFASDPPSAAPEVDPAGTIAALTLLAGLTAIVRGKRA